MEFNIIPLGVGISVSKSLVHAVKELDKRKVKYEITSMGTIFEAKNIEEAFDLVREAHEAVFETSVKRVVTTVRIDDRRDVERSMEDKSQIIGKNDQEGLSVQGFPSRVFTAFIHINPRPLTSLEGSSTFLIVSGP